MAYKQDYTKALERYTTILTRLNKPNLYEIVLKGFAFDEAVQASKENYEKLKELDTHIKRTNG